MNRKAPQIELLSIVNLSTLREFVFNDRGVFKLFKDDTLFDSMCKQCDVAIDFILQYRGVQGLQVLMPGVLRDAMPIITLRNEWKACDDKRQKIQLMEKIRNEYMKIPKQK